MLNGKPVDSLKNVFVENTSDSSRLTAKNCDAVNAGKYTVTAQNEAGMDTADFTVAVIGRFMCNMELPGYTLLPLFNIEEE